MGVASGRSARRGSPRRPGAAGVPVLRIPGTTGNVGDSLSLPGRPLMPHVVTAGRCRAAAGVLALCAAALGAQEQPHNRANWELADKFSAANLRSRVFSTAVTPHWLGQSDSL